MFLSLVIVLAVTLAVTSASHVRKHEAVSSAAHFDALAVPEEPGFAAKVLKLSAAQHKKLLAGRVAEATQKNFAHSSKKESKEIGEIIVIGVSQPDSFFTQKSTANSDCSGQTVTTTIERMNDCIALDASTSMRKTCDGLTVTTQTFYESDDCTGDFHAEASTHSMCDFDVASYENMGRMLMSANKCIKTGGGVGEVFETVHERDSAAHVPDADVSMGTPAIPVAPAKDKPFADPLWELPAGYLTEVYLRDDCKGRYHMAFHQHLNACTMMQKEDGDYFYYKILGCDYSMSDDRFHVTMVGYSDRNCQRPFVKDVDSIERECDGGMYSSCSFLK